MGRSYFRAVEDFSLCGDLHHSLSWLGADCMFFVGHCCTYHRYEPSSWTISIISPSVGCVWLCAACMYAFVSLRVLVNMRNLCPFNFKIDHSSSIDAQKNFFTSLLRFWNVSFFLSLLCIPFFLLPLSPLFISACRRILSWHRTIRFPSSVSFFDEESGVGIHIDRVGIAICWRTCICIPRENVYLDWSMVE